MNRLILQETELMFRKTG